MEQTTFFLRDKQLVIIKNVYFSFPSFFRGALEKSWTTYPRPTCSCISVFTVGAMRGLDPFVGFWFRPSCRWIASPACINAYLLH